MVIDIFENLARNDEKSVFSVSQFLKSLISFILNSSACGCKTSLSLFCSKTVNFSTKSQLFGRLPPQIPTVNLLEVLLNRENRFAISAHLFKDFASARTPFSISCFYNLTIWSKNNRFERAALETF
jgi:hypothetical protein